MHRRSFLAGLASVVIAPLAAEAQAGKVYRIGFLAPLTAAENAPFFEVFRHGLRELGDVEGQNIALEVRYADGRPERFPELAAELVRLKVDVIVAPNNPGIVAAQRATSTIPIVMGFATDPVALGFVASLARPGGQHYGVIASVSGVCRETSATSQGGGCKPLPRGRTAGSHVLRLPRRYETT